METEPFRSCTRCGHAWESRDRFIHDPHVSLVGYQPHFDDLKTGLLLFNHDCGTTLTLPVLLFTDLYDGPVFEKRRTGTEECPGHCLHGCRFEPCPAHCECAFVREILQILRRHEKE